MTPEKEMESPSAGRNGGDGNDATTTYVSNSTSKSSESNGGQVHSQGGCTGRGSHQGCGGRGGSFN